MMMMMMMTSSSCSAFLHHSPAAGRSNNMKAATTSLPMAEFKLNPEETAFVFIEYQNEFCTVSVERVCARVRVLACLIGRFGTVVQNII
jgi:hypothetical protein